MSDEKNVEGKGFVIRDKRQFTTGGESKPETEAPVIDENTGEKTENAADRSAQKGDSMPFPEINFSSFVLSISSSVLLHFGDIADPVSGKKERNLPMAKQTIDILAILKDKTKGNLTNDEDQLLDHLLHDLRLKYVQECKKS